MVAVLEGYFFKNLIDIKSFETKKFETTQNCTFFQTFCLLCYLRIPLFLYANRCCQKVCRKEPNCAKISFCNIVRTKKKLKMITYSQIALLLVYLLNCCYYISNLKIHISKFCKTTVSKDVNTNVLKESGIA